MLPAASSRAYRMQPADFPQRSYYPSATCPLAIRQNSRLKARLKTVYGFIGSSRGIARLVLLVFALGVLNSTFINPNGGLAIINRGVCFASLLNQILIS